MIRIPKEQLEAVREEKRRRDELLATVLATAKRKQREKLVDRAVTAFLALILVVGGVSLLGGMIYLATIDPQELAHD